MRRCGVGQVSEEVVRLGVLGFFARDGFGEWSRYFSSCRFVLFRSLMETGDHSLLTDTMAA